MGRGWAVEKKFGTQTAEPFLLADSYIPKVEEKPK